MSESAECGMNRGALFRRAGGVERAVGVHGDVGVERGVLRLDAVEGGANEFDGRQRTRGDQTRQLACGRVQRNRHQGQSTVPSAACRVPVRCHVPSASVPPRNAWSLKFWSL